MVLVVHLDNAPRIHTTTDFTTIGRADKPVGADDSKRHLADDVLGLSYALFVLVLVRRRLEDVDVVMSYVCKNLHPGLIRYSA